MKPDPQAAVWAARDAEFKHERQLVYCRQMSRPVMYRGLQHQIAEASLYMGDTEMTIYLNGSSEKVRPCELTIPEIPT